MTITTGPGPVRAVCHLNGPVDPALNRTADDDRDDSDRSLDWAPIEDFLLTGARSPDLPTWAWLTQPPGSFPDAVHLYAQPGLLISTRLRDVLDTAAPGDLDHHPITVEGHDFWLTRIVTVLDALDLKASGIRLDRHKQIKLDSIRLPFVWKSDTLTRPAIFRIPNDRNRLLATDTVAAAVLRSGCIGISVAGPLGIVR